MTVHPNNQAGEPVLVARGVSKRFGPVAALRDVDLTVRAGEVHAIVGENGAGKSTLMGVLAGAVQPDTGTVTVGGRTLTHVDPHTMSDAGVARVHQEKQLFGDLSVAENVLVGRLPARRPAGIDWREARRRTSALLEDLGIEVEPRRRAGSLTPAEGKAVEVARAMASDALVVIMDEPTAVLGPAEAQSVAALIRRLRERGRGVIYISHHMDEVFELADTVTVMRDGAVVASRRVADTDAAELVRDMFGEDVGAMSLDRPDDAGTAAGDVVLRATGLRYGTLLNGVDLQARRGEILCVAGGIGSGRRELARCLAGALPLDGGAVEIGPERRSIRSRRAAVAAGVAYLPGDRKKEGLFLDRDVVENVDVVRLNLARTLLSGKGREQRAAVRYVEEFAIQCPSVAAPLRALSGGNQQKVLLARWLRIDPQVLILEEPTAGVDISSKLELYKAIRRLADEGAAIVVLSSDYEELKLLADRAVVLVRGRVRATLARHEVTDARLLGAEREEVAA
jgi:ABC-type sugar transport system ATPase subunit